jgi:hypothetical protein
MFIGWSALAELLEEARIGSVGVAEIDSDELRRQ